MHKINETHLPRISKMFKTTPCQLRMIADKLEVASRNALPGETVTLEINPHVTVYFDPEISAFSSAAEMRRTPTEPQTYIPDLTQ